METVLTSLKQHHFAPEPVNDQLSARVFELYLKRTDNDKRYFLAEDIAKLQRYKYLLDEETVTGEYNFFREVDSIFAKRFVLVKGFYEEFLSKPFNLETEESIETEGDKLQYAKTEAELKERWRQNLKYQVLARVYTAWEVQEKAKANAKAGEDTKPKTLAELEADARSKVLKSYETWAKEIEKNSDEERFGAYVNTFANAHEPHSSYFPPLEKENFNIKMSGKLEGIGAQLIQEDGFVKVTRVVPGSASFRQGELEAGDKIIKVAQGEETPVDVVDMKLDDVLPMIRGKKGTEVRLTVKKQDGSIKIIPIIRDVVVLEDSYAKSAIIEHKKGKVKVGLVDLRSFYADFQDPRGRRCARDVRQEVQKLLAENVDGIVIDLRYNGGGSLADVVDMTGLFIERGPVSVVMGRDNQVQVLEDRDPSILYAGPLVILVNAYSASASEIMAAALQDYGRALIVGTDSSTFGKGTVQRFFDLDPMVPQRLRSVGNNLGAIKVTIQKFYRINGGSTQLRGVQPDIILPNPYRYMKVGERQEEYPMAWTEIEPSKYRTVNHMGKLDKIKKKSQKRVEDHATFKLIEDNARWYKELQEQTTYPLSFTAYQARKKAENERAEKYKAINKEIPELSVRALASDLVALASDTLRAESAKTWHKNLQKDPYIEEVVMLLNDLK